MLDSGSWTNSNRKCTNWTWTFLDYLVFAWFIDHALPCLQRTFVRYNHLWLEKLTTKFLTPSSLFRNCGYWAWTRSFVKKLGNITIAQWLSVNFSCRDIVGTVITANLNIQEEGMPVSSLLSIFLLFYMLQILK